MRSFCATTSLALMLGITAYVGLPITAAADANGTVSGGTDIGGQMGKTEPGTGTQATNGSGAQPAQKEPKDFTLTLGLGAGVAPDYEGSNDYRFVPIPMIEASWKDRLFLSNTSLSLAVISTSYLKAGPMVTYAFGRDRKDNHALRKLGNVGDSVEIGGFIDLTLDQWRLGAKLTQDVANGHGGAVGELSLAYALPLGDRFTLTAGSSLTWASKSYMESFFGISSRQSARSGLSKFNADAGFKNINFSLLGTYNFSEHWNLNMIASYSRLLGDAADSPIVKDKGSANQFMTGVGLSYTF